MRLTEDEYKALLARCSGKNSRKVCKLERGTERKTQGQTETKSRTQAKHQERFKIVIIAKRRRDVDPDNLCPKWYIDELVKQGYLPDDSSRYVESVEKRVERCSCGEEETTIEIWKEE